MPAAPIPRRPAVLTPVPRIKSPAVVIGESALSAADAVASPVPPFAIGRIPVTPVVNGRPVALVKVTEDGVPKAGVIKVGLELNTMLPDPVTFWPRAV